MTFQSILCPVDFSADSRNALRYAGALAQRFGGRLTVMFANDLLLATAAKTLFRDEREFVARTRTELAGFVDAGLGSQSARSKAIALVVAAGDPADEILRRARRLRADCVVLGTHGLSGVPKLFFGSTTEQTLHDATMPVLAVPPARGRQRSTASPLHVTRVVVPIDLAGAWESDAIRGGEVAAAFDAELRLVHVVRPLQRPPWLGLRPGATDKERLGKATSALERVRTTLFADRRSTCTVMIGDAVEEIARIAEPEGSLVVMSLRDRVGMWGARRGSVAYRVLTEASTPVLALPRRHTRRRLASRAAKAVRAVLTERDRREIAGIDAPSAVRSRE